MVYNNPKMLMLYTNWQKNNVKGEKRMKKYMKQIVSWMCAVLMTLSMAVPVFATNSNAASVIQTENRPNAVSVKFSSNSNTQIVVGKMESKISFDLTFTNPSPEKVTTGIYMAYFGFENETGECKYFSTDKLYWSGFTGSCKTYSTEITGDRVKIDTVKAGTYKLKEIWFLHDPHDKDNPDKKTILPVSENITIEVKNPMYPADDSKRPNGIKKVAFSQNSNNKQIEVGNAESEITFDVTFTNPNPGTEATVRMFVFCFVNDEKDKCAFYYNFKGLQTFLSETQMFTIPIKGTLTNNKENIKGGTYKLTEIKLFENNNQSEDEKTILPVSQDITIEVKNPLYVGGNNNDSKPTEEEIGGKYESANITTGVSGELTATVAMTDISSQVSANLNADSKAFAKEQYNITVKSNYIPENSKVEVGKVLAGTVYNKVASLMSGVGGFRAFEINILDVTTNAKVQPTGNGTVYVTVDLPTGYNKNTVDVYRINDDASTPIKLNIVARTDSSITFETNHFSTFVIAKNAIPEANDTDNDDDDNDIPVAGQSNNTTTPSNNAGTADTTNKAPKTGDMAPLAALLFVMICGGAICAVSVKKMITR